MQQRRNPTLKEAGPGYSNPSRADPSSQSSVFALHAGLRARALSHVCVVSRCRFQESPKASFLFSALSLPAFTRPNREVPRMAAAARPNHRVIEIHGLAARARDTRPPCVKVAASVSTHDELRAFVCSLDKRPDREAQPLQIKLFDEKTNAYFALRDGCKLRTTPVPYRSQCSRLPPPKHRSLRRSGRGHPMQRKTLGKRKALAELSCAEAGKRVAAAPTPTVSSSSSGLSSVSESRDAAQPLAQRTAASTRHTSASALLQAAPPTAQPDFVGQQASPPTQLAGGAKSTAMTRHGVVSPSPLLPPADG